MFHQQKVSVMNAKNTMPIVVNVIYPNTGRTVHIFEVMMVIVDIMEVRFAICVKIEVVIFPKILLWRFFRIYQMN